MKQGGTSWYTSPLVAPRADFSFFRKRPSSSSCRCAKRGRGGLLPPHHPGQALAQVVESLLQKGAFRLAPLSSLDYFSLLFCVMKALESWRPVFISRVWTSFCAQVPSFWSRCICKFRCIRYSDSFLGSWRSAKVTNSRLFALVSPRLLRSSRGSWLRVRSLSMAWIRLRPYQHGWLFRHPAMSRFFFSEDGPPVVKLSRNSRQLREVSACFSHQKTFLPRSPIGLWQFLGLSSPETSPQASLYWLPVSIMCGSTCGASLELMRMRAFLRYQGVTRSAVFEPDGSWSSALGGAPFHLSYASAFMGRNTMLGIFSCLNPILDSIGHWNCQCFGSFEEGGRCQSTCSQPHYLTVASLIGLRSSIPILLGRSIFSNHELGGRRMLFLHMRWFLRFSYNSVCPLGSSWQS